MAGGTVVMSMVEAAVSEGMATVFAREYAGDHAPWGNYPDDVASWVEELEGAPVSEYQQWMFQHPDGRRWIGYRTGTYLVDRATEATGRTSIDLVRTPATEVIALGEPTTVD